MTNYKIFYFALAFEKYFAQHRILHLQICLFICLLSVISRYSSTVFWLALFLARNLLLFMVTFLYTLSFFSLSLTAFKILSLLLILNSLIMMPWCSFIHIYSVWNMLRFLGLWAYGFTEIWKFSFSTSSNLFAPVPSLEDVN